MAEPIRSNPSGQQAPILRAVNPVAPKQGDPIVPGSARSTGTSFSELLRLRQGIAPPPDGEVSAPELRFSAHAQTRIQSRQIVLQPEHLARLQGAVQKAAGKGSRDALILLDDMALVVSVKNRTVVTVVDKEHLQQNVFTNIDSAVIA